MADFVFNVSKGSFAEKARDDATKFGVMLLKSQEAETTLKDRDTLADILAHSTEADFTNYARIYPITATLTVDDTNDRVDLSIPDQTINSAGGASNNTIVRLVVYYQDSAADSGRIPITGHDFAVTTDGTNLALNKNQGRICRATGS